MPDLATPLAEEGGRVFGGMAVPLVATMPQRQGVAVALNYLSRVYFRDPSDAIPPVDAARGEPR